MPDVIFNALDLGGLNETAEQVRAIAQGVKDEIDVELDSLDFAQADGRYPFMTVGSIIGPENRYTENIRESTTSGIAHIVSIEGNVGVATFNNELTLESMRMSGIRTTDENSETIDTLEIPVETYFPNGMRRAGAVADELSANEAITRVGVVDLGTLSWTAYNASSYPNLWYANIPDRANSNATTSANTNWEGYPKDVLSYRSSWNGIRDNNKSWTIYPVNSSYPKRLWINDSDFAGLTSQQVASLLSGKIAWFELDTPQTSIVSTPLDLDFKVVRDGAVIAMVPDVDASPAPIITVSDPLDWSVVQVEFTRIWEAIASLMSRSNQVSTLDTDSSKPTDSAENAEKAVKD